MKEYKVVYIKPSMNPDKVAYKIENVLNEMAGQGWEFKFSSGVYWTFEREK
jgi:hypothetical protein